MDETLFQTLVIALVFALIFGPLTARSSHRRDPIRGGLLAQVFNLIGSIAFVALLPSVIVALILGGGFGTAFPVALGFLVLCLLSMLLYALFEAPARRNDPTTPPSPPLSD